ncbi:hypothetical protein HC766_06865 [Candidatus Gracilibacteria bacterium]|nr:hypothetical protein [Candidatus Gracilibacteria bacterium]
MSDLEKHIVYWLAIEREWTTLAELRSDFVAIPSQSKLLDAVLSLRGRSLIEKMPDSSPYSLWGWSMLPNSYSIDLN